MALSASVEPASRQLEHPALWDLRVEIRNDGSEPVQLATATMLGPVSFEVVDATGARVPLGPPPVPPTDPQAGASTVEPGASLILEFHGDELFPDAPPPGRYRLRFAWDGRVESPWVEFEVA